MSAIDLKNRGLTENVFEKVDTLFSLIRTLPSNVQEEALAEIRQRLTHNITKLPENTVNFVSEQNNIYTLESFSEGSGKSDFEENNNTSSQQSQTYSAPLCKIQNCSFPILKQCEVKLNRINEENTHFEKPAYLQKETKLQEQICQYSEDCRQREEQDKGMINSKQKRFNRRMKKLKQQDDLMCTVCNQSFCSQSSLKVHIYTHSGIFPHKCDICEKQFSQKSSLGCHMRRHRAIKPFKCPKCDYSAVAKIDVERHIPTHTKQRNYACNICDKSYFTKGKLKDHINNVHNRTIREVCEICGFATHSKDVMRRHRIVKHTNQETFQCPVCNIIIKQKGTFLIHMRIHTGERPYSCKECSKTFKSRSQLASHTRIHQEGEFICETCGHKFRSRSHLQRHIVVHTGAKPFSCHLCLYTCNVRANITKHVRSVHGLAQFTLKEASLKPISENIKITSASERGFNVAKECLKKLSAELGSEMTVQELQQKEAKSQNIAEITEGQSTEQETCIDKGKEIPDTIVSLSESPLATTCVSPPPPPLLPCDIHSNSKEKAPNSSRDILLDAMKLLTSVSTDEEEPILADASFLHRSDQTLEIDSGTADNLYMYIFQVFSDETNSF